MQTDSFLLQNQPCATKQLTFSRYRSCRLTTELCSIGGRFSTQVYPGTKRKLESRAIVCSVLVLEENYPNGTALMALQDSSDVFDVVTSILHPSGLLLLRSWGRCEKCCCKSSPMKRLELFSPIVTGML